jgi:YidC/Oxa1 family membrane protein insertase
VFELITQSMLFLLESLKAIVGNYGWAIVALTVLVRLVLWPVSKSQMKAMKMMQ